MKPTKEELEMLEASLTLLFGNITALLIAWKWDILLHGIRRLAVRVRRLGRSKHK